MVDVKLIDDERSKLAKKKRTKSRDSPSLRVLIADDNDAFRSDLRHFLERQEYVDVVGEAGNGMRAINLSQALRPDLILLDISMPGIAGPEAVRVIKRIAPDSKIVFVSVHEEGIYRDLVQQMGLGGFISKRELKEHLPRVLDTFKRIKGCPTSDRGSAGDHADA